MIINEKSSNVDNLNDIKIGDHISIKSIPISDYNDLKSHYSDAYYKVVKIEDPYIYAKIDSKIAGFPASNDIKKIHKSNITFIVSKGSYPRRVSLW